MAMKRQLSLCMHPDDDFWMTQVGHLQDMYPETHALDITITDAVEQNVIHEQLRMLCVFRDLEGLSLTAVSSSYVLNQQVINSIAEHVTLKQLHIHCGTLPYDVETSLLTSLRSLQDLSILPFEEYGLVDDDMEPLTMLTALTSLRIRASPLGFTNGGILKLKHLTSLHTLHLCPLGENVTAASLSTLKSLPNLQSITVGLTKSNQVMSLSSLSFVPSLSIKATHSNINISNLISVCNWCLPHNLSSLSIAPASVCASDILLSLSPLTNLSSLKLTLTSDAPPPRASPTPDLSLLSPLSSLQSLHLFTSVNTPVKITVKSISILALSLPHLTHLCLSPMSARFFLPESLDLLDNFSSLLSLSLCAPPDLPHLPLTRIPVHLRYLPPTLTHLTLERAHLLTAPEPPLPASPPQTPPQHTSQPLASRTPQPPAHIPTSDDPTPNASPPRDSNPPAETSSPDQGSLPRSGGQKAGRTGVEFPQSGGDGVLEISAGNAENPGVLRPLLPHLVELELEECWVEGGLWGRLMRACTNLKRLELGDVEGLADEDLQDLTRLSLLTRLAIRVPTNPSITTASLSLLPRFATLRHLEWATHDIESTLDVVGLAPTLCCLTNLRHMSLATKQRWQEDWRSKFKRYLPYCTISLQPCVEVQNCWDDCTSLV